MLDKLLKTDGLSYIVLKAIRDFIMIYAGFMAVDGFAVTQDSMVAAAVAAAGTTAYRFVREVLLRFEVVVEDS